MLKCHAHNVQIHLQPFRRISFLNCVAPEIAKKSLTTPYFGGSRSFKVIDADTNKKLVTIACYDKQHMSLPICNRFHATQDNWDKITTFFIGVSVLTPTCAGLLVPRGSRLKQLKSTFKAKSFGFRLSWSISSHFVAIRC